MLIGRGRWIGHVAKWVDWCVRSLSVVVGAFAKTDSTKFVEPLGSGIRWLQQGWVVPALLIGGPVIVLVRHRTDRSKLKAVHSLLDQICDNTFKNQKFEHEQHRRATLFRYRYLTIWRWPFIGGWLVPIERSGNLTRRTDAIWRAPDNGERAEAVAGRAWSRGRQVYVPGLPDLRTVGVTEVQFRLYGERSFCDPKKLRSKPPQARSLIGIPINVDNKPWGVLVLDSVLPTIPERAVNDVFKKLAPTMTSYLKGL